MSQIGLFALLFLTISLYPDQITGQDDPYEEFKVVAGELGTIYGTWASTIDQPRNYVTFNGIPYADPTSYTGLNRFKPSSVFKGPINGTTPEDSKFWALNVAVTCPQGGLLTRAEYKHDIRKLFRYKEFTDTPAAQGLPQNYFDTKANMGSEDCLALSVNTPKIPKSEDEPLLPVILFIHGGSSDSIWGSLWNGMRLLHHDVVLISINYRLSILGSLNLGIDAAPGNAAMYDAVTSLEWTRDYIKYFGGDPARVTIAGHSAGSMMVTHLLVSPLAKGLFHGVIGNSGSALAVWGTARHPSLPVQLRVCELAGCYDSNVPGEPDLPVIAECMINMDIDTLLRAEGQQSNEAERAGEGLGYEAKVPSIQNPDLSWPLFLPEHPVEILRKGEQSHVPLFLGGTKHDGSFALEGLYYGFLVHNDLHNNGTFLKEMLFSTMVKAMGMTVDPIMINALSKLYLGEAKDTEDFPSKIAGLIDMTTVFGMKAGSYNIIEYQAQYNSKCYTYSFDFKSMWPFQDFAMNTETIPGGVGHIDDMLYLFQFLPLLTVRDIDVSRRYVQYWVNFAKYGNPNGNKTQEEEFWPRYDPHTHPFLVIDKEDYVNHNYKDSWVGAARELMWKPNPDV